MRKTRIAAFNSLIGLNLALAMFAGLIVYLQFGRDVINIPNLLLPVVDFFGSNWDQFARVIGLCVLVLVFNVMGYLLGFDFLATQRPFRRLMLLHAQLPLLVIFTIASPGIMDLSLGLSIAIFLVILTAYATLAWQIERLFGKILTIMVRLLLAREKYIWSNRIAYLSILFRPNQVDQRKALGISRYETGDIPGTIKVLEPLVYNGFDDMQILEILEECYHVERQWDKVFEIEKREIAIQPRNPVLRMRTARGLEKLQKYAEAVAILREGLPLPKLEYQELYFQNLFEMRDLPSAIEVVHEIESLDPGPDSKAFECYARILEVDPRNAAALEGVIDLFARNERIQQAAEFLEHLLELQPDRHDLRMRLVNFYQDLGRLHQAEPHLEALMDAGEQNADIALMFGDILVQRKQYDKALMHFQYAEEQYPTDYRFPYFLAQIYFETQALEDALRWSEEAERRADDPEARGRVLSMRRRVEDALIDRELQVLRDRCDRDPENIDLRLQYIAELARHNMAERAVGEYDELMEKRPELKPRIVAQLEEFAGNPERHFRLMDYLADLKLKDRLYDDAFALACKLADKSMHPDHLLAEHCRRILRRRPDHLPSLRCLGQIMKKRQEWDQVLELYQRYQKLTDDDIKEVRESIFLANMHLGHVKEALELGESFLREYPHEVEMRVHVAQLYVRQYRFDEAMAHLQHAQSTDYYNLEVARLLREVAQRRRDFRLGELQAFLESHPEDGPAHLEIADLYVIAGEIKKAITHFQKASRDPELKNISNAKLANAMARLRMFDLSEETLDEVTLNVNSPEERNQLKALFFEVAEMFESEDERQKALKFYKKIFRVDASFRNVVDKIEMLGG